MRRAVADRMFLLQFGAEPVAKRISVHGAGDSLLWEPIIGVLVSSEGRWVLLEAGIGRRLLEDADALEQLYPGEHNPWGLDGEPLVTALAEVGVGAEDLSLAAVSHLHCDHSGGLETLRKAGIPIAVQADELAFATRGAGLADGYYPPDYGAIDGGWVELDGDSELAAGVSAVATPGHTPGHMSYRVDLADTGTWLFAVDAADLGENLVDGVRPGQTVDPDDGERAERSLRRLRSDGEALGARLVPGHDPVFWRAVRHPAGGHR